MLCWIYNSFIYNDFNIECGNDLINSRFNSNKLLINIALLLIFELELLFMLFLLTNILNYNLLLIIIFYLFSILEINSIGK